MAASSIIGWYADRADPALASIRLRMLWPMQALRGTGWCAEEYDPARGPSGYHTLVFSKSLTQRGLALARSAQESGCRVVYDLCDNLHAAKPGARRQRRIAVLEQFLQLAEVVVLATPALREQLLARYPQLADRSVVIADALETIASSSAALSWTDRWLMARLQRFLGRHPGALHCVWFGKSQGEMAGLAHLDPAVRELETFARSHPVTLTVISNRWARYRSHSSGWRVPHYYLPWSLSSFGPALRAHHVAVIPVGLNDYTRGKSINRPAAALLAGLGVVADPLDSYEELREWVALDGWQAGLHSYVQQPPAQDRRLAMARAYLSDHYGEAAVARRWGELLAPQAHSRRAAG